MMASTPSIDVALIALADVFASDVKASLKEAAMKVVAEELDKAIDSVVAELQIRVASQIDPFRDKTDVAIVVKRT